MSPPAPFAFSAAVDFQFKDPERGFDRSRVKGVVAKLVRVADPTTTTALEVRKLFSFFARKPCGRYVLQAR